MTEKKERNVLSISGEVMRLKKVSDKLWVFTLKSKNGYFEVKCFGDPKVPEGEFVNVEGRIQQETWEKDGKKNYKVVIISTSVMPESNANVYDPGEDEDLPF